MKRGKKRLAYGLERVLKRLPEDEREDLKRQFAAAHQHLLSARSGKLGKAKNAPPRELFFAHSLLSDDAEELLDKATWLKTYVGSNGAVYNGGVDYDATDVNWAYCLYAWHETEGQQPPFRQPPAVVKIPNTVTLAILGDWGGNNQPARDVAKTALALNPQPDYFIHLGDVYYAGTSESGWIERDYQRKNFLDVWPGAKGKSLALNSNHDMYAHGAGYFNAALKSPIFGLQKGCSYFALYNDSFRIVGLDTAYFDKDRSGHGFMDGTLDPSQESFLQAQAKEAAKQKQRLILLSHHNGLSLDGTQKEDLWGQVAGTLSALQGKTAVWYWGHEHAAAVYSPALAAGVTIAPRCCGHGCIPWGLASDLANGVKKKTVSWYEKMVVGPGTNYFVTNGFATLTLKGSSATEAFYGQDPKNLTPHWQGTMP